MVKPSRFADVIEVVYSDERWQLFRELRARAEELMRALARFRLEPLAHGSIARGDVDKDSDVDVFLPQQVPSYGVEYALHEAGFRPIKREIVIATPQQLPKAHIYVDANRSVTFPLLKPRPLELEFYRFGGAVDLDRLGRGLRVPGVDKRLMLIEPVEFGHVEGPVIGREAEVAKRVGVSLEIVRERVRVLTRRGDVGHTGVFVQRELAPDESFEAMFEKLVERNPAIKLRLRGT